MFKFQARVSTHNVILQNTKLQIKKISYKIHTVRMWWTVYSKHIRTQIDAQCDSKPAHSIDEETREVKKKDPIPAIRNNLASYKNLLGTMV